MHRYTALFLNTVLALLVSTLVCFSAYAEPFKFKHLDKQNWLELETDNFVIVSNLKSKGLLKTGLQLEKFRAFSELFIGAKTEPKANKKDKIRLFLTKSGRTWNALGYPKEYVSSWSSSDNATPIIFVRAEDLVGSQSLKKPNEGRAILFSAIAGELLNAAGWRLAAPDWFVTGMELYLATYSEPKKNHIMIGDTDAHAGRYFSVLGVGQRLLSFETEDLLRTGYSDNKESKKTPRYRRIKNSNRYMTRSFVLVHYMYAEESRRDKFGRFLDRVMDKEDYKTAFLSEFEFDLDELDKRLKSYATGKNMFSRMFEKKDIEPLLRKPILNKVTELDSLEFFKTLTSTFLDTNENIHSQKEKQALVGEVEAKYGKLFEPLNL